MDTLAVNWVDLVVVTIMVISAMLAFSRGLMREMLGIGSWIIAGVLALDLLSYVRPVFRRYIDNPDLADPAAYASVFLIALVSLSIVSSAIAAFVRGSMLNGVDRTLGIVFGLVRGAALVAFAYIAGGIVLPTDRWPEPVQEARVLPIAYYGAAWAVALLPEGFRPHVDPPPIGRQTRAADLLHANPQGRALDRP